MKKKKKGIEKVSVVNFFNILDIVNRPYRETWYQV